MVIENDTGPASFHNVDTFKKTTAKVNFLQYEICIKTLHTTLLVTAPERFRIVTYSCAARFQQKGVFIKFTFFISRTKQIYTKPINISESMLKIK